MYIVTNCISGSRLLGHTVMQVTWFGVDLYTDFRTNCLPVSLLTLSSMGNFTDAFSMDRGAVRPPPPQPMLKMVSNGFSTPNIPQKKYRAPGLKKVSDLNIFQKFLQKWTLSTLFPINCYTPFHMWENKITSQGAHGVQKSCKNSNYIYSKIISGRVCKKIKGEIKIIFVLGVPIVLWECIEYFSGENS